MKLFIKKPDEIEYDFKRDAFLLVLYITLMLNASLSVGYILNGIKEPVIFVGNILSFAFCVVTAIIYKKTGKYTILSASLISYLLIVYLPMYIIHTNQARGASPLWFASAAIAVFFMVDTKRFWWIFPVIIYWDSFIFVKYYVWSDYKYLEEKPLHLFLSVIVSFVAISIAFVLIISIQEKNLRKEEIAKAEASEKERQLANAKSRFLANVSHEIRTPMNSIVGLSELMLKDEMDDATKQEVSLIRDSSFDLLDIIDNVLTYAKLDDGKISLTKVEFKPEDMLRNIIESYALNVQEKNLQMYLKLNHNIPSVVSGDDVKIRQVINRLLFISLSLTYNGRIMFDLDYEIDKDRNTVMFKGTISDTGIGLSEYDLNALYGAYGTYDSRQNSTLKGIGLKFAICRELLKLMNGEMDVESLEGIGIVSKFSFECDVVDATPMINVDNESPKKVLFFVSDTRDHYRLKRLYDGFNIRPEYATSLFNFEKMIKNMQYDYVFIPKQAYSSLESVIRSYHIEESTYVIGNCDDSYGDFGKCKILRHPISCLSLAHVFNNTWNADDYSLKNAEMSYDGSNAKILVVDDNGVNLKVASGIFKNYKINIDVAKSGMECLKKMEKTDYHLVLMDMVMPEMSGKETLDKIRASQNVKINSVPVVALTASTGGNIRNEIIELGFEEYLAKPMKARYLLDVLNRFLPSDVFKPVKLESVKTHEKRVDLTSHENLLDIEKGLATIGFNEESYIAILNTYYSEGMRKVKLLYDYLEAGNISLFTTDVHGIKSSSASIGAMTVSEMFKELEMAGKANDLDEINKNVDAYTEAFKKILDDVKAYLEARNSFWYKDDSNQEDLSDVEKEILRKEEIEELKSFIDKMSLKDCDRILENLVTRNFGSDINEKIVAIKNSYDMFDFHTVKKSINEILAIV